MRLEIHTEFPVSSTVAFEYLVHMKDCDRWMDPAELLGTALLFKDGRYNGFLIRNVEESLPPLFVEVQRIEWGEFVVYRPLKATEKNVPKRARRFFPYVSITQSLRAMNNPTGCLVIQEIELVPKGIVGWAACKFGVMPSIRRGVEKSNGAVYDHLSKIEQQAQHRPPTG